MSESNPLDVCYEQIYDISHNQENTDAAQVAGGAISAGLVISESALTPSSIVVIPAAFEFGFSHGADVALPLEAFASFVDCGGRDALSEISSLVSGSIFTDAHAQSSDISTIHHDSFSVGDTSGSFD